MTRKSWDRFFNSLYVSFVTTTQQNRITRRFKLCPCWRSAGMNTISQSKSLLTRSWGNTIVSISASRKEKGWIGFLKIESQCGRKKSTSSNQILSLILPPHQEYKLLPTAVLFWKDYCVIHHSICINSWLSQQIYFLGLLNCDKLQCVYSKHWIIKPRIKVSDVDSSRIQGQLV